MEKNAKQIEKDVFDAVKKSVLGSSIKGTIYRDGMRPDNAKNEDIVVKFLSGIDGQEQSGVVLIHIYVPDIKIRGYADWVENTSRIEELERLVNETLKSLSVSDTEYLFSKDGTPHSFPVEGIKQHFINARIKYRRITF